MHLINEQMSFINIHPDPWYSDFTIIITVHAHQHNHNNQYHTLTHNGGKDYVWTVSDKYGLALRNRHNLDEPAHSRESTNGSPRNQLGSQPVTFARVQQHRNRFCVDMVNGGQVSDKYNEGDNNYQMYDHGWNSFATFNKVPYMARDFLIYDRALTIQEIKEISKGNILGHKKLRHYYEATEPLGVCNTASDPVPSDPVPSYQTVVGAWGQCSKPCDTGTQNRTVQCKSTYNGQMRDVSDSMCEQPFPPRTQYCNKQDCAAPTYQTIVGDWDNCDKPCGKGTRRRELKCLETAYNGQTNYVPISKCSGVGVPHGQEDCNTDECPQVEPACTDGKHDIEYFDSMHGLSGFPRRVKYNNSDFWYSADPTKTSQPPSHAVILITTVPSSRKTLFWNSFTSHSGPKDPEIYIDPTRISIYQDNTFDGYVHHNAKTGDEITVVIFCDALAGGSHPGGKLLEAYVKTNDVITPPLYFVNDRGNKVGGSWFAGLQPGRHRYKAIRCHQWYTSDQRVTPGSIRVILDLVGGALSSPPNATPASYDVIASEWGPCSKDCGGGKQTRNLTCKRTYQGITEEVDISNCSGVHNPHREQDCNTNACDNVEQRGGYLKYTGCQGQDDNGNLPNRPQNANWDDCKNLCNQHSNCGGFNHSDQTRQCFLKPRKPGVSTKDYTNCNDWAAKNGFNFYKKQ